MKLKELLAREAARVKGSTIARNTGWLVLGQMIGLVMQAATFILLARLLGPYEYGAFAGAFAFTMVAAQYTSAGMGTVLLRYVTQDNSKFSEYWGNLLLTSLVVGSVMVAGLTLIGSHFLNASSAKLVIWCAISNCFGLQLTFEIAKAFQAFEKMVVTSIMNLCTSFVRLLTVLGLMLSRGHVTSLQWAVASMLVTILAATAGIIAASIRFGRPHMKPSLARRHGLEGLGYAFALSTSAVYNDIDKTMLSHYGMNSANGIYSMAYRAVDIATAPIYALRDASLPSLFRKGKVGLAEAAKLSSKLLTRAMAISAVASLACFLIAPVLPHLLGPGFAASVSALRWLALIPLLRSVHQITGSTLTGAGLQRYRTAAQVCAAITNLGLNIWLIPKFGWIGAAWASLLTDGFLGVLNFSLLKYLLRKKEAEISLQPAS